MSISSQPNKAPRVGIGVAALSVALAALVAGGAGYWLGQRQAAPSVATAVVGSGEQTAARPPVQRPLVQPLIDSAAPALQATAQVAAPLQPPSLNFASDGFILPKFESTGLPIATVNLSAVKVSVFHISERSVIQRLRSVVGRHQLDGWDLRRLGSEYGAEVWTGTLAVDQIPNQKIVTALPLDRVAPIRRPGLYLVTAEAPGAKDWRTAQKRPPQDEPAASGVNVAPTDSASSDDDDGYDYDPDFDYSRKIAAQWVMQTDIGLSSFEGADGLTVIARSFSTAQPLAGVELSLITRANDETVRVVTDRDGVARIPADYTRGTGALEPKLVMAFHDQAGKGGDFALLDLTRPGLDLSDRGVDGAPYALRVDGFLYTDRGIYRPGETVQVSAQLRDGRVQALAGETVRLELRRPNEMIEAARDVTSSATGLLHQSLGVPKDAPRGLWTLELRSKPLGTLIARQRIDVQDFVPQKLKVTAGRAPDAPAMLRPGQAVEARLDGYFLYGAPAADLQAEATWRVEADPASFAGLEDWQFGRIDEALSFDPQVLTLYPTDTNGRTPIRFTPDAKIRASKPLRLSIEGTIFETGGRPVGDALTIPYRSQDRYIGLRPAFAGGRVNEGDSAAIDVLAVDATGSRIAADGLHARLIREEIDYTWYREGDRWRARATQRDSLVSSRPIQIAADQPARIAETLGWGRYRLEIATADVGGEVQAATRFRVGWGGSDGEIDRPDSLSLTLDKAAYRPGDTARLKVKAPSPGTLQLVIASDKVLHTRSIDLPQDEAEVALPVADNWGQGVYILASAFRPLGAAQTAQDARRPARAIGAAWLAIDPGPQVLSVALEVPDKILPMTDLRGRVQVAGLAQGEAAEVTIAVVDEGILQLTRFKSPSPTAHYFAKRRLGLKLRDDYNRLIDGRMAAAGETRQGGDAFGGVGLPAVPTITVALHTGIVPVGPDGSVAFSLPMPDFVGQVRVMATVSTPGKVGQTDGTVFVRHPVVVDPGLPRFLAPGDNARMTVLLHNLEHVPGDYRLAMTTTGPVAITSLSDHALTLERDQRITLPVDLAANDIGTSDLTLVLTGPQDLRIERRFAIAARSPHAPITLEDKGVLAPGQSFTPSAELLGKFRPGSVRMAVNLGGLRGVDVAGLLQSLDRYPFGCTEQIASRGFPLLVFDDLAVPNSTPASAADRVRGLIRTLVDRQGEDGEIGLYRAGDGNSGGWVTVAAIDFLLAARAKGHPVPDTSIERSIGWLRRAAQFVSVAVSVADRWLGADRDMPALALTTRAYALYVLAQHNEASLDTARRLAGSRPVGYAHPLGLALLGGALVKLGDVRLGEPLLAQARTEVSRGPANIGGNADWDYYGSGARNLAGVAAILAEQGRLPPDDPLIALLAQRQRSADQVSTQEKSWTLRLAAAALSGPLAVSTPAGPLASNRGVASLPLTADQLRAGVSLRNDGPAAIARSFVIHGAPLDAPPALSDGIRLTKTVTGLTGDAVDIGQQRQHDRLVIQLRGAVTFKRFAQLALVDLLPAGWEVERVLRPSADGLMEGFNWIEGLSQPLVLEGRDDRVVASVNVNQAGWDNDKAGPDFAIAYIVRAVTPGRFTLPGASAEDMYRPAIMARTAAQPLTITPR